MTKADFLKALEEHDEVKFPGSSLRAPTFRVGDLLCDALTTVLREGEMIRFGVQISTFPESAAYGQLVWLLLLRAHLLELVCTAAQDEKGNPNDVPIVARAYPIDSTLRVESKLEYAGLPVTTRPLTIGARISLGAAAFEIKADRRLLLTNEGVSAFVVALLESASR